MIGGSPGHERNGSIATKFFQIFADLGRRQKRYLKTGGRQEDIRVVRYVHWLAGIPTERSFPLGAWHDTGGVPVGSETRIRSLTRRSAPPERLIGSLLTSEKL